MGGDSGSGDGRQAGVGGSADSNGAPAEEEGNAGGTDGGQAVGSDGGQAVGSDGGHELVTDGGHELVTDGGQAIGGVLLAAGQSTRFEDGNKLLAEVDGVPVVRRATETLLAANLRGPVVVLGHDEARVRGALGGLDVEWRVNEDYADGQHTSVALGVAVARERDWDAVVFALGDMPAVDPDTVDELVGAYREGTGTVLAPAHEGQRGNPVLFARSHFEALAAVTGDRGGREIVEAQGTLVPVDDPGVLRDVDRVEDL
ncbi:MAG: nucleotidyltransferase family protein [Haloarculaceae archaeon]